MKKFRGFNLIELMVVIAIIAILASIALPMYGNFQRRTRLSNVIKSISEAKQGFQQYYQEFNSFANLSLDTNTFVAQHNGTQNAGFSLGSAGVTLVFNVTPTNVSVSWVDTAITGCVDCGGAWCVKCDDDRCWTSTRINNNDTYRLDGDSDLAGDNACTP